MHMSSLSVLHRTSGMAWPQRGQRLSMYFQVLQLRSNRLLGGRPQTAVDIGVHPGHDFTRGTVPCGQRGPHLVESLVPVVAIKRQPRGRVSDDRPVTGEKLNDTACGNQVLEEIERVEVRRKITVGIGDHSRAPS